MKISLAYLLVARMTMLAQPVAAVDQNAIDLNMLRGSDNIRSLAGNNKNKNKNKNGGSGGFTENHPCVYMEDVQDWIVESPRTDAVCLENNCPNSCCRIFSWLTCDSLGFNHLPCVCNGNTQDPTKFVYPGQSPADTTTEETTTEEATTEETTGAGKAPETPTEETTTEESSGAAEAPEATTTEETTTEESTTEENTGAGKAPETPTEETTIEESSDTAEAPEETTTTEESAGAGTVPEGTTTGVSDTEETTGNGKAPGIGAGKGAGAPKGGPGKKRPGPGGKP